MSRVTLLRGGHVYSPVDPFATAMVVVDDTIAWVGQDGAADMHADGVDQVLDLAGALVTPAFVDAHVHLTETGLAAALDLSAADSLTGMLDLLAASARADASVADGVLVGHGWDETTWPQRRVPTAQELERAVGDRPAYLGRVDSHSALVTPALATRLNVSAPSGLVSGEANDRCRRASRDLLSAAQRAQHQRYALSRAASLGVSAVHEMGAPHIAAVPDLAAALALGSDVGLPEVYGYWGAVEALVELDVAGLAGDLRVDGALGSRTAWLVEPYADAPEHRGSALLTVEEVGEHVLACSEAGRQGGFHCIGDAAVDAVVQGLLAAERRCGTAAVVAARHRMEHAEMVAGEHLSVLARLGVVLSVQPAFDERWGGAERMYAERLGVQRAATLNPFAAMVRAGVSLAMGSDSPVTPIGPWAGVRAASRHRTPAHRLTVRAAFAAHTRGGWRAARVEDVGVLAPGARADYAVWQVDGDLLVQTPDERVAAWSTDPRAGVPGLPDLDPDVPEPTCLRTVRQGRTIYQP